MMPIFSLLKNPLGIGFYHGVRNFFITMSG
jgi:hypothetical protein